MELLCHFHLLCRFHHLNTWSQIRHGRLLQARCDHILVTDPHRFKMVGIEGMGYYSSDQLSLRDRLLQQLMRCYGIYLPGRHAFLLSLPKTEDFGLADNKYQKLKALNPTPIPPTRPYFPDGCQRHQSGWLMNVLSSVVTHNKTGMWHKPRKSQLESP